MTWKVRKEKDNSDVGGRVVVIYVSCTLFHQESSRFSLSWDLPVLKRKKTWQAAAAAIVVVVVVVVVVSGLLLRSV